MYNPDINTMLTKGILTQEDYSYLAKKGIVQLTDVYNYRGSLAKMYSDDCFLLGCYTVCALGYRGIGYANMLCDLENKSFKDFCIESNYDLSLFFRNVQKLEAVLNLQDLILKLGYTDYTVIRLKYNLDNENCTKFTDIGIRLGKSANRVRQLHSRALRTILYYIRNMNQVSKGVSIPSIVPDACIVNSLLRLGIKDTEDLYNYLVKNSTSSANGYIGDAILSIPNMGVTRKNKLYSILKSKGLYESTVYLRG